MHFGAFHWDSLVKSETDGVFLCESSVCELVWRRPSVVGATIAEFQLMDKFNVKVIYVG